MKNLLHTLAAVIMLLSPVLFAQLSAPAVEEVYGGRINTIAAYVKTADTTRVIIATESANSLFYADIYTPLSGSAVFGAFNKVPGADASANFGSGIQSLVIDSASGYAFFACQDGVYKVHPESGTAVKIISGGPASLFCKNSVLIVLDGNNLRWGSINASGSFTESSGSPLILGIAPGMNRLVLNRYNDRLHIFSPGNTPQLYISSAAYTALSSTTTFASVSLSSLSASYYWSAFGVSGSGRYFAGGHDNNTKYIAYSDNGTTWTSYNTGINGVTGNNFDFGRDTSSYYVYFSSMYNNNKGAAGSWQGLGNPGGMETHPNDGAVLVDPNNNGIVYMTTDQGIGASTDMGATIFEIDEGVEAVQVDDFDMIASKNTAWLASKSGIRKVTNYLTTPIWTNALFPNGDGSPYYSAEMAAGDTNVVYVGNLRVYKTIDGGNTWSQVFTAEHAPYNFNSVGPQIQAIEVCDFAPNLVMAGYFMQDSTAGGLFYSSDAGASWNQILLHASSTGHDVDVMDIVFNLEGTDTIAYVGVEYDLSYPAGRSVYKLTKAGSTWTVSQDMNAGGTSTGSLIVASIRDLHVSSTGDTIYAAGTDAGINHPIAYYKPLNTTGLWTPLTTSGFPFSAGKRASAITLGIDTLYCAVDNEIYYIPVTGSAWSNGYTYPVGTRINFLYFDDLLAGTGTGLYGHSGSGVTGVESDDIASINGYALGQNYPNPFNPSTTITFTLSQTANVSLMVYDILGREVASLFTGVKQEGIHTIQFDAKGLPTGIYIYELRVNGLRIHKKMTLLK